MKNNGSNSNHSNNKSNRFRNRISSNPHLFTLIKKNTRCRTEIDGKRVHNHSNLTRSHHGLWRICERDLQFLAVCDAHKIIVAISMHEASQRQRKVVVVGSQKAHSHVVRQYFNGQFNLNPKPFASFFFSFFLFRYFHFLCSVCNLYARRPVPHF